MRASGGLLVGLLATAIGLAGGGYLLLDETPAPASAPVISLRYYCPADGAGPVAPIDWAARQAAVSAIPDDGTTDAGEPVTTTRDAAQAVLDAERRAMASHVARNGNAPRTASLSSTQVDELLAGRRRALELVGDVDGHGGRRVVLVGGPRTEPLLCPECASPIHGLELHADGGSP